MRLAVWSPLPPSPSGIADYVAEQLPLLAGNADVTIVVPDPEEVAPASAQGVRLAPSDTGAPEADLDLYHVGNSPAHAYVYRQAVRHPGVLVLHEWSVHHLVLGETVGRGETSPYLHEMRRAYGERGTFVGRQVARALGGDVLPALFPLNERLLETCLGLVGLTRYVTSRAAPRLGRRPVLHLPHHAFLPFGSPPSKEEARRALGLPVDALVVTAPGLATASKRLSAAIRAIGRLRSTFPTLRLVVAGAVFEGLPLENWAREAGLGEALVVTGRLSLGDFVRHVAAADVVLALRYPTHGEMSGALLRALGVGRPVLVTAGTPAAEEFPEGVVVPVDPGPSEEGELEALLSHLLQEPALCETIGRLAREHVARENALPPGVARLFAFLVDVNGRKEALRRDVASLRVPEGERLGFLLDEIRFGALDLGLPGIPAGVESVVRRFAGTGA